MAAAKGFFARMYQPGGRLWREGGEPSALVEAAGFEDFEVPGGLVRDVMRVLYSGATRKWLQSLEAEEDEEEAERLSVRDISRGWVSQVAADGGGRVNIY